MKLETDFDLLDTYMSVYGDGFYSGSTLKVYLKEGLGVPLQIRDVFPRRYFFDPWSRRKYGELNLVGEVLVARVEDSAEWVEYRDKAIAKEILKYEYVGGCWFVFEGVSFSVRKLDQCVGGSKGVEGPGLVEVFGLKGSLQLNEKTYFLEGALDTAAGSGWVSWEIHAKSFHIQISES